MPQASVVAFVVVGVIALVALAYWQLILAEGVYLGRRVVVWLYDRSAAAYDGIKDFDPDDDADFLGQPLAKQLAGRPDAQVLDVATGTGRLPLTLLAQPGFQGTVVALDASREMLTLARAKLADYGERATLLHHDAAPLPFADASFDAVTCIEALEFLPDPGLALREMARVLRPGGTLLVSPRVGIDRLYFPGRAPSLSALSARLTTLGLRDVEARPWQTYYSLVWATRDGSEGAY